jgi:hypothetical protein
MILQSLRNAGYGRSRLDEVHSFFVRSCAAANSIDLIRSSLTTTHCQKAMMSMILLFFCDHSGYVCQVLADELSPAFYLPQRPEGVTGYP